MQQFIKFLSKRTYRAVELPDDIIMKAFDKAFLDYKYHFPDATEENVRNNIINNQHHLPVYLYRLGREILNNPEITNKEAALNMVSWLNKEVCNCEIYFNNNIDIGFLIVHSVGIVIGSRNTIGKAFIIHQGCTIGHKENGMGKQSGNGAKIGDNVKMYANSSIIGDLSIGNNVIIGAHSIILKSIDDNKTVYNKSDLIII